MNSDIPYMYRQFLKLAHPDRFTSDIWHGYQIKFKFGLTKEKYDEMLKRQGGVCAICDRPETAKRNKRLAVDHDPKTGTIRGLLCGACNQALGLFQHDRMTISNALNYINPIYYTKPK